VVEPETGTGPVVTPEGPTITPIEPTAEPRFKAVELALRSEPSGAEVYPFGSGSRLCTTPCDVTVNPADGGSPTRRVYVVRKAGYQEQAIEVRLDDKPKEARRITLSRAGRDHKNGKGTPPATTPVVDPKPPVVTRPPDVDPRQPDKNSGKIDPSDTLDPFRKK